MKTSSCYQVLLKMWPVIYLVFSLILLAKKHVGIQNLIKKYKVAIIQNLQLKLKAIENRAFLNNFDSVVKPVMLYICEAWRDSIKGNHFFNDIAKYYVLVLKKIFLGCTRMHSI